MAYSSGATHLDEKKSLGVRRGVRLRVDGPREGRRELLVEAVLVVPHRELVELGRRAHELARFGGRPRVARPAPPQRLAREAHGFVVDVVVRRDGPAGRGADAARGRVDAVDLDAPRVGEVVEDDVREGREVLAHGVGVFGLDAVVRRVLQHAPEEVRPREVVDGVEARLDHAARHLGAQVVVQALVQVALDGERLVEELFVKLVLRLVHQDARDALVVELRERAGGGVVG